MVPIRGAGDGDPVPAVPTPDTTLRATPAPVPHRTPYPPPSALKLPSPKRPLSSFTQTASTPNLPASRSADSSGVGPYPGHDPISARAARCAPIPTTRLRRAGYGPAPTTSLFNVQQPVDKTPAAFERRCIRVGPLRRPAHTVMSALHIVILSLHLTSSRLRSSLPFGRIALLFASQGALPTRRLAALGAHGGLSTDCQLTRFKLPLAVRRAGNSGGKKNPANSITFLGPCSQVTGPGFRSVRACLSAASIFPDGRSRSWCRSSTM